jgi:hypothetical protein
MNSMDEKKNRTGRPRLYAHPLVISVVVVQEDHKELVEDQINISRFLQKAEHKYVLKKRRRK